MNDTTSLLKPSLPKQSLPKQLHDFALDRIIERFNLREVNHESGGPYLNFQSQLPMHQGSCGAMRLFKGDGLFQLVTSSISVPAIQLDSHMLFAFTASASGIPHFTVDSVRAGGHHAFHLDLIPRVDLGSQLTYMNEVYQPLTEAFITARSIEGLTPAQLSPRQIALMSPWMLASRANESAFIAIENTVSAYLEHWFGLFNSDLSKDALAGISANDLTQRDRRNKAALFNIDVDPVWKQITPILGESAVNTQIEVLRRVG